MSDMPEKNYHTFHAKTMLLKELLPMIRGAGWSNYDESGTDVIICPECEEWTHARFNRNSCLLDLLGNLVVTDIDAKENDIVLWVETDEFNWFKQAEEVCDDAI